MRTIKLGTSDLQVPVVAVGFWRLNRNTDVKTAEDFSIMPIFTAAEKLKKYSQKQSE